MSVQFRVGGFCNTLSNQDIGEALRKPRELTAVLFLKSQGPYTVYLPSTFQSLHMLVCRVCPGLISCKRQDLGRKGLFHLGELEVQKLVLNIYSGCSVELGLYGGKDRAWALIRTLLHCSRTEMVAWTKVITLESDRNRQILAHY